MKKLQSSQAAAEARYKLFAEAWLANGGNATQAAIDAGYSKDTATEQGSRLLTHAHVVKLIREAQARVAKKFELTAERVLEELARIALSSPREAFGYHWNLIPPHLWPDHVAASIASVKFDANGRPEVKFWNKNSAVTDCLKHLGQFEKDNRQRVDPLAELIAYVQEHNKPIPVRA